MERLVKWMEKQGESIEMLLDFVERLVERVEWLV